MSDIIKRSYRLGKAYLNQYRDRIDAELSEAERELEADADRPPGGAERPARDDASPDALFRRAQEKIQAAQAERDARQTAGETRPLGSAGASGTAAPAGAPDPNASDFRVLGLAPDAGWDDVLAAYEKITGRCDPRRFPDGSTEQREAGRILERVNTAYDNLRKRLDPTESRFARLEFDSGTAASGDAAAPASDAPPEPARMPPELN